jgi:hypothetical protein
VRAWVRGEQTNHHYFKGLMSSILMYFINEDLNLMYPRFKFYGHRLARYGQMSCDGRYK